MSPDTVHLLLATGVYWIFVVLGAGYLFFGLDDLFIDCVAWLRRLGPAELGSDELRAMSERPEKRIAIIVPAWKEGHVISRMLTGNCRRLDYHSYHIFVGVYPNDPLTRKKVLKVNRRRNNIRMVMNDRPGPTSKGQMLNRILHHILEFEKEKGIQFDAIHMQDAEDIFHPKILRLANAKLDHYDFIQTPVFSLDVKRGQLVAATYMDEFAESHTKDILVRESLGAAVPSAGVGTCFSRRLLLRMMEKHGHVFNEGSLTEDYELGVRVHREGFTPHFACCFYRRAGTKRPEYIATREYFPKKFNRSVRQKTRWSLGICLQGWRNLGWSGGFGNRYFLYRDRKGIGVNIAVFLGYPVLLLVLFDPKTRQPFHDAGPLAIVMLVNLGLMANRIVQRIVCVARVYGGAVAVTVPFSWPLANVINAFAGLRALQQDAVSRITRVAVAWASTEHELPEFFGETTQSVEG